MIVWNWRQACLQFRTIILQQRRRSRYEWRRGLPELIDALPYLIRRVCHSSHLADGVGVVLRSIDECH